jgi:CBS domain-containing protein
MIINIDYADAATLILKKKVHRIPIVNKERQVIG